MREHSQLEPLDQGRSPIRRIEDAQKQARALLDEPDMAEMAKEELAELEDRLAETRREIQLLLLPKDPNAERNVVMETGGGAGGEGGAVRRDADADVYAIRRAARLEDRDAGGQHDRAGRREGGGFRHHGEGAFSRLKYRERRAPRSAHR